MTKRTKYTGTQLPLIALEVARAGKILARAVLALREEYESFRRIDYRVVKTLMQDAGFRALVATAEKALEEKCHQEVRELVRADVRRCFQSKPQPPTRRRSHGKEHHG